MSNWMRLGRLGVCAAAAIGVSATAALAEGWSTTEFPFNGDRDTCVRRAEAVGRAYQRTYGAADVTVSGGTVGIYDAFGPDDALIFCVVADRDIVALGIAQGDCGSLRLILDRLEQIW